MRLLENQVEILSDESMKLIIGGDFIVRVYNEVGEFERSFFVDTNNDGDGMPYDAFMNGSAEFNWNGVMAEASNNGYYSGSSPSLDPGGPWWDNRDGTTAYTNPQQLNEVSVRPMPSSVPEPVSLWHRFAFGAGVNATAGALGFQADVGGSFVYFPYSSSVGGYAGGSVGVSSGLGAGASIDAKPYLFFSTDRTPLEMKDLQGEGREVSLTFMDYSASVVWAMNDDDEVSYVGVGVGPGFGASLAYTISWFVGYHIIYIPLPTGLILPIPVKDDPNAIIPDEAY